MGSTPKYSPSSQISPSVVSALFSQQTHSYSKCSFTPSKLRFFVLRAPKLTLIIQLLRIRSYITRLFLRCTCTQNAHLRLVNSAFSYFVRLKLTRVIQLLREELAKLLVSQYREGARCGLYLRIATAWRIMTVIDNSIGR